MGAPFPAARLLEASELGARLHPLDRALVVLRLSAPNLDEDLAALPIAERDRRLIALRHAMFGDRMGCVADCPVCGGAQEFELSAGALLAGISAPRPPETLRVGGWAIALRPLDSRDLAVVATAPECDAAAAQLAGRAIRVERGPAGTDADAPIPGDVRAAAVERVAEREGAADLALDLNCSACGAAWTAPFDIGAHLWVEIDAEARRLIGEVAALAARFGWAESDLLAMPAARRRAYLEAGRPA
jgi:hypothetical protein